MESPEVCAAAVVASTCSFDKDGVDTQGRGFRAPDSKVRTRSRKVYVCELECA